MSLITISTPVDRTCVHHFVMTRRSFATAAISGVQRGVSPFVLGRLVFFPLYHFLCSISQLYQVSGMYQYPPCQRVFSVLGTPALLPFIDLRYPRNIEVLVACKLAFRFLSFSKLALPYMGFSFAGWLGPLGNFCGLFHARLALFSGYFLALPRSWTFSFSLFLHSPVPSSTICLSNDE
jgi:hypothetical protein